ncbi:hypothetical protein IV203_031129 [Nitzschia inconspicua]|uniref:Uncharacterized protein n=1 Tax=Nitzschia inconspicua TaxID=303405 RepID=A0A9K3LXF0_9STRA|nr:hypothetical protein IV203_031129 [Nitzschia inconspicua]
MRNTLPQTYHRMTNWNIKSWSGPAPLFALLAMTAADAFVLPPLSFQLPLHDFDHSYHCTTPTQLQIVWDPRNAEVGSEWVDFPTPSQRTELKKEAKRRIARKKMPLYFFPNEETDGPWSLGTFEEVWSLLVEHEMITLRGICRKDRKSVYQTALLFCGELEDMISASQAGADNDEGNDDDDESNTVTLPVAVLSYQGHSALIYCPTLPTDHPDKFLLRTSVGQKNVWTAREKPLRDDRGQIIKEPRQVMDE